MTLSFGQIIKGDAPMEEPSEMDAEANAFALELLMPEDLLRREAPLVFAKSNGDEAVERLAVKFKVPKEVMYFRLIDLGIPVVL